MKIDKDYKMRPRYDETLKHLRGEVLDIGCHVGLFDIKAIKNGFKVTGMDISPLFLIEADKNAKESEVDFPLLFNSIESLPSDKKYDTIVLMEIIEHLENLDYCLSNVAKILKDDGQIIITTPVGYAHYSPDHRNMFFLRKDFDLINKHWMLNMLPHMILQTTKYIIVDEYLKSIGFDVDISIHDWGDSKIPSYDFFIILTKQKVNK